MKHTPLFILLIFFLQTVKGNTTGSFFADFYISTEGNDKWSGKLSEPNQNKTDGPFATIGKAKMVVRMMKKGIYRDIFVLIRGGAYPLKETEYFTPEDGHMDGFKVIYMAYPGEHPVFSSDVQVSGWVKSKAKELPGRAKGNVFEAPIPIDIKNKKVRIYSLYDQGKMMQRACSKGFEPTQAMKGGDGGGVDWIGLQQADRTTLHYHPGSIRNWPNLEDIEVFIEPNVGYVTNYLPLKSVDEKNEVATTAIPATYPMGKVDKHLHAIDGGSYRVENAIDYLDAPGKWVVNTLLGKIYYWPENGNPDGVTVRLLTEYFLISGNEWGSVVKNIAFRGLTFTRGDRDFYTAEDVGLQHDWDLWNKANALVRFRDADNCEVSACRFTNSASAALRFDLHAQGNVVKNNLIDYVGGTGISLCGYGPGTLHVNKYNKIVNNQIHHCGQLFYQSMGIMISQSEGNVIKNNKLHDLPYDAIVVSGARPMFFNMDSPNREIVGSMRYHEMSPDAYFQPKEEGKDPWVQMCEMWDKVIPYYHCKNNIIEENEIFRVMDKMFDGNAIYLSDVSTGNEVRRNYIHHLNGIGMQQGIRTDAFIKHTTITENVVYNCNGGGINVKYYENNVTNNIVARINDIVYENSKNQKVRMFLGYMSIIDVYSRDRQPAYTQLEIARNIFYKTGAHNTFYREWKVDGVMKEHRIEDCNIDYNLYYDAATGSKDQVYLKRYQTRGADQHSVEQDPMFEDLPKGNFKLKAESPALKLGFRNIDMTNIGLTPEFPEHFKQIVTKQLGDRYDDFEQLEKDCLAIDAKQLQEEHSKIN